MFLDTGVFGRPRFLCAVRCGRGTCMHTVKSVCTNPCRLIQLSLYFCYIFSAQGQPQFDRLKGSSKKTKTEQIFKNEICLNHIFCDKQNLPDI